MTARARISHEQETVEVDVMRERLQVARRKVDARAASAEEIERAFQAQTVRIPVLAEQAGVHKELFVTDEVVVERRVAPVNSGEAAPKRAVDQPEPVEVAGIQLKPVAEPLAALLLHARRVLDDVRAGWRRARRAGREGGAE